MRNSQAVLFVSCILLAGCSAAPVLTSNSSSSDSTSGLAIRGKVHGGQSPIAGADVYLYAVNDTGYAGPGETAGPSNASVLVYGPVTSAADGSFSMTGDFSCSTIPTTPNLYLLSAGGSPGGSGPSNTAIVLAAGLGPCTAVVADNPYVVVNEASTVAAAYAAAAFATDAYHVSSSSSALAVLGVEHALGSIVNLVTQSTGVALATTPAITGGNGTVPQAEINTLANILAACVNSASPYTACTTLFNNAESGGVAPTDTAHAILNIAHNPGANISNLMALQGASPPFVPDLPASPLPNDFTIAISFTGGGLSGPWAVAVTAADDILVTNYEGTNVSAFTAYGDPISSTGFTGNGLSEPFGIAVDGNGNVFVADITPSAVSSFSSNGTAIGNVSTGGLDSPEFVVVDSSNDVWADSYGNNSLDKFTNSSGTLTAVTGSPFGTSVLNFPYGLADDVSGNLWVSNKAGTPELVKFNNAASSDSVESGSDCALGLPEYIAFDPSGNAWVTDDDNKTAPESYALCKFSASGSSVSGPYYGGGLVAPNGIAIDSNGNIFVANSESASPSASYYNISEFNSSGTAISGSEGYQSTSLSEPYFLAIDGSGNLWVTNFSSFPACITEFIGLAAPVVTPMVANFQGTYAANNSAVNRP